MTRKLVLLGVGAAALVVAASIGLVAATGSSGSAAGGYGAAPATTAPSATRTAATVTTAKTGLGQILVDGQGRTLYLFEADSAGTSNCASACASVWPPLTAAGAAHAGAGARAAQLGSLHRSDGTTQVTYHGHPLYLYAGDTQPGATNGQGLDQFGAKWYVLAPSGNKIDND